MYEIYKQKQQYDCREWPDMLDLLSNDGYLNARHDEQLMIQGILWMEILGQSQEFSLSIPESSNQQFPEKRAWLEAWSKHT